MPELVVTAAPTVPEETKKLAEDLRRLKMALSPRCVQMAIAMHAAGVHDLTHWRLMSQTLSSADMHSKMIAIFPFSILHTDIIRRHLRSLFPDDYPASELPADRDVTSRPKRACRATVKFTFPGTPSSSSDSDSLSDSSSSISSSCNLQKRGRTSHPVSQTKTCTQERLEIEAGSLAKGAVINVADRAAAKAWLLDAFKTPHIGGHVRCINSRYVQFSNMFDDLRALIP